MIESVGSLPVGAVFELGEERTRISSIERCPSHPATHVLVNGADCWPRGALVDVEVDKAALLHSLFGAAA